MPWEEANPDTPEPASQFFLTPVGSAPRLSSQEDHPPESAFGVTTGLARKSRLDFCNRVTYALIPLASPEATLCSPERFWETIAPQIHHRIITLLCRCCALRPWAWFVSPVSHALATDRHGRSLAIQILIRVRIHGLFDTAAGYAPFYRAEYP